MAIEKNDLYDFIVKNLRCDLGNTSYAIILIVYQNEPGDNNWGTATLSVWDSTSRKLIIYAAQRHVEPISLKVAVPNS